MAIRRSFLPKGNYKYPFFVALILIVVLIAWLIFMNVRGQNSASTSALGEIQTAPSGSAIARQDQKIVSIQAHDVTVSSYSAATFKEEASSFAVDANTKIYRQVPKDDATIAQEAQEYEKKVIAAGKPIMAPLHYTLAPATFQNLVVGMRVIIEYKPNAAASATSTQVARSIEIEPESSAVSALP